MSNTTSGPTSTPAGWYPDPHTGQQRWWDGSAWGQHAPAATQIVIATRPSNGAAIAALILGIAGFVLTPIPLFIGLFVGGIPDVLAIIFGIVGIVRAKQLLGAGTAPAVVGLVLGSLGFLSIFIGAGTIW